METLSLSTKINSLPENLKQEVQDFVDFLIYKKKEKVSEKPEDRIFGELKGKIHLSPDFDAPLDDFKEYM